MCFLRDKSEQEALEIFNQAKKYKGIILGIGLDSYEVGNPPSKF